MPSKWLTAERLGVIALIAICVASLWFSVQSRSFVTSEAEKSRQDLTSETASWTANLADLESKIGTVEAILVAQQTTLDNAETTIAADRNAHNIRLSAITTTLEELQAKVSNITIDTETIADTREDLDDLESDVAKLKKDLKKLDDFYGDEDMVTYYNERNGFNESDPTWFPMWDTAFVGQQFEVDEVCYIRSVKLYLKLANGSPTTVSLRLYDANDSGLPTGSPWFKENFNPSNWEKNDPRWHEFEVDNQRLDLGEEYVLVLQDPDGNKDNYIAWGYDRETGEYDDGRWVKFYTDKDKWEVSEAGKSDGSFEIWAGVR